MRGTIHRFPVLVTFTRLNARQRTPYRFDVGGRTVLGASMADRSVYYRLTDAGWSRHIVPHVSRPWPDSRRPVDTAPRSGIYGGEMYHDGIRQREQCLVDMAEDARRLGLD